MGSIDLSEDGHQDILKQLLPQLDVLVSGSCPVLDPLKGRGAEALNSGPHALTVSTSPREPP